MNSSAFLFTFIAGFSTMLGSIPIFFNFKSKNLFVSSSLAFAAGVMICVSITDLIPESLTMLSVNFGSFYTVFLCFSFVIAGIILSMLIDRYLPSEIESFDNRLYKVGIVSMLAIILHNIPEGIATYVAGVSDTGLAISLTIAIALHNIPEGIGIAIPIYYSTKSMLKAIFYTFISALSEPLGALIAYLFLSRFNTTTLLGILFSIIAGIMMQIGFCELLPTSFRYNYKKFTYLFFVIGVLFMIIKFII